MEGELQEQSFEPIDIRKVIRAKSPKLARRVPGFFYNWLSRILHLREVNEIIMSHGHLKGAPFVGKFIESLNIRYEIVGEDFSPTKGERLMFVSNHPLGGLDGTIILKVLNEKFGTTRTLANDFLMAVSPLKDWFVPINKVGSQVRHSAKLVEEMYESETHILIFPAGLCSRKIKGKVMDLTWQKHFIQRAVQQKMNIVPVFFEGRNSNFFYNLARIRKALRIKFNIEMVFLVDEMFRQRNQIFRLHIGNPIPWQTFTPSKRPIEWAEEIKQRTYALIK